MLTEQVLQANQIEKPFLKALAGEVSSSVPFWFMRQAGRYLPEYRELRAEKGGFLAMAMDPPSACEITMQPIRRFEMDAAIIFSDILTIPYALGQHLEFVKGEGPKLNPIQTLQDFEALNFDCFDEMLDPVYQALTLTRNQLDHEGYTNTALIGFSGAPWTVATYMIEGGGSKDFAKTKRLAYADPQFFGKIIDTLVGATSRYLISQIKAGAEAIQIFDSWSGVLPPTQFRTWCIEPAAKIAANVRAAYPDIPIIGFPKGAALNYPDYIRETKITAAGIDFTLDTKWVAKELQPLVPVQGNLDPMCLLAGGDLLESTMQKILSDLSGGPFVFNLGHGIHKDTPIAHVEKMVQLVRDFNR